MNSLKFKIDPENINKTEASPKKDNSSKFLRPIQMAFMLASITVLMSSCMVRGGGFGYNHRHEGGVVVDEHRDGDRHRDFNDNHERHDR